MIRFVGIVFAALNIMGRRSVGLVHPRRTQPCPADDIRPTCVTGRVGPNPLLVGGVDGDEQRRRAGAGRPR